MLYFLILPLVVGFLMLLVVGAIVCRLLPNWRHVSGYLVGSAIGTALGFIVANGLLLLLVLGTLHVADQPDASPLTQQVGGFGAVAGLILGPIVATAAGVALGLAAGVFFVFLKRRRRAI